MKWCLMERYVVQLLFFSWSTAFASLPTGCYQQVKSNSMRQKAETLVKKPLVAEVPLPLFLMECRDKGDEAAVPKCSVCSV